MRHIKFRGKCQRGYDYSDGDGWIYGSLLQKDNSFAIVRTEDIDLSAKTDDGYSDISDFGCIPVIPDTIGQFTGSYDKNGKEIYEGDIIKYQSFANWDSITGYDDSRNIGTVYYNENKTSFFVKMEIEVYVSSFHYIGKNEPLSKTSTTWGLEIIGNIHDNPELLNPQ